MPPLLSASNVRGICFVIAPIGEVDSEPRKRSDQVLKHVIRPAAFACGFSCIRADEISEPGMITTQIIQHIVDDPMVVADLTGRNPNVFYELAVRHALRKPYVQIIQKGERIPFDVAGVRTIEVDHRDLDNVETAKSDIQKQMESALRTGVEIESPISVAVDLDRLRRSDNPEERSLAEIIEVITELRVNVVTIQKQLSDPTSIIPPMYMRELMAEALDVRRHAVRSDRNLMELRHLLHSLLETTATSDRNPETAQRLMRAVSTCEELLHRTMREEEEAGRWIRSGRAKVDNPDKTRP